MEARQALAGMTSGIEEQARAARLEAFQRFNEAAGAESGTHSEVAGDVD